MIAIRFLELTKPLEIPSGIEDKQAVRIYCSIHGQIVGHVTIWHKGRPIGRNQLIQEISHQLGLGMLWATFGERIDGEAEPWQNVERAVKVALGLAEPELPPLPPKPPEEQALPKLTVSITIPTRDRPEDIKRCLESLTNHKSRLPFEIIVADNNPASGKTEPIVRSFPGVVYIPEPRPGVTFARNAAALHAGGDIIVCTDDDVTYEEGWLDNLIAPYANPQVMATTGMVVPFELEHPAQYWFEVYGGLTRNYHRTSYDRDFYDNPGMPMVPTWDIGVTANCSFRAEVFADPQIGPFDDKLRIAEDPYLLYRLVKANKLVMYEPRAVVRHRHRATMEGLARQLYNYGRSSTGMQLRTYFVDGDIRGVKCLWDVVRYDRDRLIELLEVRKNRNLFLWLIFSVIRNYRGAWVGPLKGRTDYPLSLVLAETKGHLVGPFSLLKSIFQVKTKLGHYTAEQFALAQAARRQAKAAQPDQNQPQTASETERVPAYAG
jgi:O-antigen biosynthesis protein